MFGDEYKLAGLPSLNQFLSQGQIKRITFSWVLTTIASAFLVIFFIISNSFIIFLLLIYILYLLASLSIDMFNGSEIKEKTAFYKLNLLYLLMMIFLIVDGLLRNPEPGV
jgi:protoheme IX farnesyltransferase